MAPVDREFVSVKKKVSLSGPDWDSTLLQLGKAHFLPLRCIGRELPCTSLNRACIGLSLYPHLSQPSCILPLSSVVVSALTSEWRSQVRTRHTLTLFFSSSSSESNILLNQIWLQIVWFDKFWLSVWCMKSSFSDKLNCRFTRVASYCFVRLALSSSGDAASWWYNRLPRLTIVSAVTVSEGETKYSN